MNKFILGLALRVLAVGVLAAQGAIASDDLETEPPTYLAAHLANPGHLKAAFGPNVRLRMIEEPSFQISSAVFLEDRGGHSFIVRVKMDPETEYAIMRHDDIERLKQHPSDNPKADAEELALLQRNLPPYPKDDQPQRCEIEIDAGLAAKITAAWRILLQSARPNANELGLDGTFYHFALMEGGKTLLGQTWSPGGKTRPGRLVAIASMMGDYCTSRRDAIMREADLLVGAP